MGEPEMVFFEKRLHPKGWRYVCPICGKSTTGHIPHNRAPRKTMPRSHLDPFGRPCPGAKEKAVLVRNYDEAIAAAKTIIEFMSIPEPMSGCWLWMGAAYDESSYGSVQFYGIKHGAHRLSFEAFHRRLVHGELVLHSCDNPLCVNPGHLRAGSNQDNADDRRKRPKPHRPTSNEHKLSLKIAREIRSRARREGGAVGRKALAREYGVHYSAISDILDGKAYADR